MFNVNPGLTLSSLLFITFVQSVRINFITILNEETYQLDQQIFARALNAKNGELQDAGTGITLHSTERTIGMEQGLSGQLKDLCGIAESTSTSWLAIVNLAEQALVFASAMAGQQLGLPVLGYVNTLEPEMFQDVAPDFYVPLNANTGQVAHAVADFLKSQKWENNAAVIVEASSSGRNFEKELRRRTQVRHFSTMRYGATEADVHTRLSKIKEAKTKVLIVFCEPSMAQDIFREGKKLNLIGTGWTWIVTDVSYTTSDDILEDYPIGSLAVKMRDPGLQHYVQAALEAIAYAGRKTPAPVLGPLQDRNARRFKCWDNDVLADRKTISAGSLLSMKNFTRNLKEHLHSSASPNSRISFEILALTLKKTRHRWTHVGNISASSHQQAAVVWTSPEKLTETLTESRRLRVVTRISHPFTIEDYPFSEDGSCLEGTQCLRLTTKKRTEIKDIFSAFEAGLQTNRGYNISCCKGLAIDLLQALSRDVGFNFDTYVVADDKDGTLSDAGKWDGIVADIETGAADLGVGPISVTAARKGVLDFSSPFYYSKFSFLIATTKRKVKLGAFLEPFSWKLWLAIFSALHATAIAAAVFEWISPFGLNPTGRMRAENFTLSSALTTVYSLFFSHVMAFKAPKSWPNKVLINFWGSFCFIILASYTANHAAIYAGLSQNPNFDNIFDNEDLLVRKVATIKGSSAETFIKNINPQLHAQMELSNFSNVVSVEDAVEKLKSNNLDSFIYDTALLDYVQANDRGCTLKTAGAAFGSQGYAVAFPKKSALRNKVSMAVLKYMESGYVDDLNAKWFGGLQCHGQATIDTLEPRALGLGDFAGVFLLLASGGAVGLLILGVEHVIYRLLPVIRRAPRSSVWRSRHVMFFSQKLYRFINCVDLVSPNSSAKEFASSLKQGQFVGMFQKSVKKRAREEALLQKRARNAENFFETIHELTRNLRETSVPLQSSSENDDVLDGNENELPKTSINGDVRQPLSNPGCRKTSTATPEAEPALYKVVQRLPHLSQRQSRQGHVGEPFPDTPDSVYHFTRSFPDFQKSCKLKPAISSTGSLKDANGAKPKKKVWISQDEANNSEDELSSPTSPLTANLGVPRFPVDEQHPYTSLRDWDDVDIEDISKQDLIKMWQSAECDLRLQIQRLTKENAGLLDEKARASETPDAPRAFTKKTASINMQ